MPGPARRSSVRGEPPRGGRGLGAVRGARPRPVAPRRPAAHPAVGLPGRRPSRLAADLDGRRRGWSCRRTRWSRWPRRSSGWSTTCRRRPSRATSTSRRSRPPSGSGCARSSPSGCCPTGPTPPRSAPAARAAGWPLPAEAAVVLLREGDELGRRRAGPDDAGLPGLRAAGRSPPPCCPTPARPGARQRLLRALRGTTAVIGPTVPLDRLPESVRVAEAAVQTLDRPPAGGDPLVAVDHLDAIIVHRDRRPARRAAGRAAAPAGGGRARLAGGAARDAALLAGAHGQPPGGRPRSSACTRRRCATGWAGCTSCSAPALDDPATRLRLLLAAGLGARARRPGQRADRAASRPPRPSARGRRTA